MGSIGGRGVALLAALGCVAGCGAAAPAGQHVTPRSAPATSSPAPAATRDPADLMGSWHLEAPGEASSASLIIGDHLDAGAALLFRPCGVMDAQWKANRHGMLVMASFGGDQTCFLPLARHPHPEPAWMTRIATWRSAGSAELLLDGAGRTVARLTPGARPRVGSNRIGTEASPAAVTRQLRASWDDPAPLPRGVRPATARDVLGQWVPLASTPTRPYLRFDAGGSYVGSDGCNGVGGHYLLGADGLVLAVPGPSTVVGCEGSHLPYLVAQSARLGLRGSHLVFVGATGKVLGDARRG